MFPGLWCTMTNVSQGSWIAVSVHAVMHADYRMKRLQLQSVEHLRSSISLNGKFSPCSDWSHVSPLPLGDLSLIGDAKYMTQLWVNVNTIVLTYIIQIFQAVKNVLSMSEKEISKQNNVDKFEIREQNKNKTEAKWKYKVRSFQQRWCYHSVKEQIQSIQTLRSAQLPNVCHLPR